MKEAWLSPASLLTLYCLLILMASLAGGWIPFLIKLTHVRLQVAISFVSGLMLGVGLLHMFPHATGEFQSVDSAVRWLLTGFLIMFFIQRFFHFHHHDVPEQSPEGVDGCCGQQAVPEASEHEATHEAHTLAHKSASQLSWTGAALGLSLHTLIGGVALAASVEAESHTAASAGLLGLGAFLMIFLHKPFDALAIATLMAAGGWSKTSRHVVNGLFALIIPLGVILFYLGAVQFQSSIHYFLGAALSFSAGTFICIAASDLLPELQFHSHDRIKLSVALLAGLGFAALIGQWEAGGHGEHGGHDHGSPEMILEEPH